MATEARVMDALVQEFYSSWFRFHPAAALESGVSGYEGRLAAFGDDDVGALLSLLESTIVALEELDYDALASDRQLDLQLLFSACRDEHHALLEQDWRHRDPVRFLPLQVVHQLVLSQQVELEEKLLSLLGQVPEYLRHGRSQLSTFPELIPHCSVHAAQREAKAGIRYLHTLAAGSLVQHDLERVGLVQGHCETAALAVEEYNQFLQQELLPHADGHSGCGVERYRHCLQHRHALRLDVDDLRVLAHDRFEKSSQALAVLCEQETDEGSPEAWLDRLAQREPLTLDEMLDHARDQNCQIRRCIEEQGLVAIPKESILRVLRLPGSLHPDIASVDYIPPAPGDPELGGRLYMDVGGSDPLDRSPAGVTAQCVRNGWSGRHLQAVIAATSPSTGCLVRRLHTSETLTKGWPLYIEQKLQQMGYLDGAEQQLCMLLSQQRQSLLALLDIEHHVDGLEQAAVALRIADLPGVSPEQAAHYLLGLALNPTGAIAAVAGWELLERLVRCEDLLSEGVNIHADILAQGAVALPAVIRQLYGDACLQKLL
ncbi:MAG: DUF885 domain-containing protein [Gammaproteobacteria bacterium]|nr:DUF885 domain-containing protein [Gammaproteobacteria bacterium]